MAALLLPAVPAAAAPNICRDLPTGAQAEGAETRCLNFDDSGTASPSNQQLCAGDWNMIGFPSLNSRSVADFGTAAIDGNFTMVWQWNSGWEQVSPPDSNNMVPGRGYLLRMTDDGVLLGMIT